MAARKRQPSPMLAVATEAINEASDRLVTDQSQFRHSFEAPLGRIRPDPEQARKSFDEASIAALAATMAEQGQLQPVLLRRDRERSGDWILVAGERRWRAAQTLGWTRLLAIEHDGDAEVAALLENLQRIDLTPVEEAHGIRRLLAEKHWTQARAAVALGRSKAEISATLRILDLPPTIVQELVQGDLALPRNVLVELARIESEPRREALLGLAREGKLTVRAIRDANAAPEPATLPSRADRDVPHPGRFNLNGLVRLSKRLRQIRDAHYPLGTPDRKRLRELRDEIDALLENG